MDDEIRTELILSQPQERSGLHPRARELGETRYAGETCFSGETRYAGVTHSLGDTRCASFTEKALSRMNEDDIFVRWKSQRNRDLHLREEPEGLKGAPACTRKECYNCTNGKCAALTDNDFGQRACPFFAPREQVQEKQKACLKRLFDEGREDLVAKYGDQLVALGIVDLGDTELEKMFSGLHVVEEQLAKKAVARIERRKLADPDADDEDEDDDSGEEDYDEADCDEEDGDEEDYDATWALKEIVAQRLDEPRRTYRATGRIYSVDPFGGDGNG